MSVHSSISKKNRQPIVICDGSDRTGKSNIVAELSRRTGLPIFKAQVQKKFFMSDGKGFLPLLRYGETMLADYLEQTGNGGIFDRLWTSERVYSTHFGRETDNVVLEQLDEAYARMDALIVVCSRTNFSGFVDEDVTSVGSDQLACIDALYREEMRRWRTRSELLIVDDEDLDREVKQILAWMKI